MQSENINNIKTPGDRLKYVREALLKISRADVYKKHGLSQDTLAAWENGKIQVTEKGIERCIKIYNSENLMLSREWLLTGEGLGPQFSFDLNRYFKTANTEESSEKLEDNVLLAKELDFFRSSTKSSVTGIISSDDMLPLYSRGDHVGGRFRYGNDIENCIGRDCIIKSKDGGIYIKRLAKGSEPNKYNLSCLNPNWNDWNSEPVLFNVEIECAAPIIWHRRADDV